MSRLPNDVVDLVEYCIESGRDPKDFHPRWDELENTVVDYLPMFVVYLDHLRETANRRYSALEELRRYRATSSNEAPDRDLDEY